MTNDDSHAAGQQPAQPPIPFPQPAYRPYPNRTGGLDEYGTGGYVSPNDQNPATYQPYSRQGAQPYGLESAYPGHPLLRPRKVTVAAVLAFISGGLGVLLSGFVGSVSAKTDLGLTTYDWSLFALSICLCAAYIWGGIAALAGRSGRILVVAAAGSIVLTVFDFIYSIANTLPVAANTASAVVLPLIIITRLMHEWTRNWFHNKGGKTF